MDDRHGLQRYQARGAASTDRQATSTSQPRRLRPAADLARRERRLWLHHRDLARTSLRRSTSTLGLAQTGGLARLRHTVHLCVRAVVELISRRHCYHHHSTCSIVLDSSRPQRLLLRYLVGLPHQLRGIRQRRSASVRRRQVSLSRIDGQSARSLARHAQGRERGLEATDAVVPHSTGSIPVQRRQRSCVRDALV